MLTAQNTLCWSVIHHLNEQTSKTAMEQRFRNNDNAEWGAYPAQMMCDETRNFPIPLGEGLSTLGDLYDLAQKDLISKVMLEEKVFKTWHSGRVVLMGDGKCWQCLLSTVKTCSHFVLVLIFSCLSFGKLFSLSQVAPCWRPW